MKCYIVVVLCAILWVFSGCAKDSFRYGDISLSPDAISGMYCAAHRTCVQADASGKVAAEEMYENNPGWPGSYTVFYEFFGNGKIVGYTRYLFSGESKEQCWYLRQTDEQISRNFFNVNVEKRLVETNLWEQKTLTLKLYSSGENEVQMWLENPTLGERWYYVYKLTKVTDASTIASLKENPMADTQENRISVMSEIQKLLSASAQ